MESPVGLKRGVPTLQTLQDSHTFDQPVKKINEGADVEFFLSSKAYKDIVTWVLMLNASMFPRISKEGQTQSWLTGMPAKDVSSTISSLKAMLIEIDGMIDQCPPDTGPRRFGNVAFRSWCTLVESRADDMLDKYLPEKLGAKSSTDVSPMLEIRAYLLGSWGSSQRLDYGTGHELSFLAFLACLWKMDAFERKEAGAEERDIVLHVVHP
jgi:serine/threonine-protein phosphatase 2A activator